MKLKIKYWEWRSGQHVLEIPWRRTKDGYLKKKDLRGFEQIMRELKGRKLRLEVTNGLNQVGGL